MIDIHSHIIPSIDDGAKSIDEAVEMLLNAAEDGTKKIIATPHYCIGYGEEPYDGVKDKVKEINTELKRRNIDIQVYPGQEVYYSTRLLEDLEEGIIGTLNNSRYMLIEFHMRDFDETVFDVLYELKIRGIIPIVAHPERYSYIQKHPSYINKFIDEGCLFQLNGGSILGKHGTIVKEAAEFLLKKRIYSFIGSDAHNNKNRKTGISEALEEIEKFDVKMAEELKFNGEVIILNEKLEFNGERIEKRKKKKRGLFSFFKR